MYDPGMRHLKYKGMDLRCTLSINYRLNLVCDSTQLNNMLCGTVPVNTTTVSVFIQETVDCVGGSLDSGCARVKTQAQVSCRLSYFDDRSI